MWVCVKHLWDSDFCSCRLSVELKYIQIHSRTFPMSTDYVEDNVQASLGDGVTL